MVNVFHLFFAMVNDSAMYVSTTSAIINSTMHYELRPRLLPHLVLPFLPLWLWIVHCYWLKMMVMIKVSYIIMIRPKDIVFKCWSSLVRMAAAGGSNWPAHCGVIRFIIGTIADWGEGTLRWFSINIMTGSYIRTTRSAYIHKNAYMHTYTHTYTHT
jgi:hypothetical protein